MDKTESIHFEFSTTENENDDTEYLIIHADETFSSNPVPFERNNETTQQFHLVQNQTIQTSSQIMGNNDLKFIPQVQTTKQDLDDSNTYNLTSQQYYVDVESSTPFVSVSDNELVLSSEVSNNAFSHAYLLQPFTENTDTNVQNNALAEEIQRDDGSKSIVDEAKSSTEIYTEITLDEEQCHSLEKNGWILLEFNNKVYLLNKNGLHDITDNNDLIQQYKGHVGRDFTSESILKENVPSVEEQPIHVKNNTQETGKTYQLQESKTYQMTKYSDLPMITGVDPGVIGNEEESKNDEPGLKNNTKSSIKSANGTQCQIENIKEPRKEQKPKFTNFSIQKCPRFTTNLTLNGLSHKMKLGKARNGKRLVAKVISIDYCHSVDCDKDKNNLNEKGTFNSKFHINPGVPKNCPDLESILELAQQNAKPDMEMETSCSAEDVSATEAVIKMLLQIPNSRDMLVGQNIVFTKMAIYVSHILPDGCAETRLRPVIVTGRVGQFAPNGKWHFIYLPNVLPKLLQNSNTEVDEFEMSTSGSPLPRVCRPKSGRLLHVHAIMERDSSAHAAVCIVKRRVPLRTGDEEKSPVGVCHACTLVFHSKEQFDVHAKSCLKNCEDVMNLNKSDSACDYVMITGESILKNKKKTQLHACSACAAVFHNEKDFHSPHSLECKVKEKGSSDVSEEIGDQPSDKVSTPKAHVCTQCKKQFHRFIHFRKHLYTHFKGDQKPKTYEDLTPKQCTAGQAEMYKCNICSSVYHHAASLTKHIKSSHIYIESKMDVE